MEKQFTFTIFTPCYNSEAFIERTFRSLQNQTFKDFEWLVINDASTDNTANIMQRLSENADFDIVYIENEKNRMLNYSYNLAISRARGKYFIGLGHDDELAPQALERFHEQWQIAEAIEDVQISGVVSHCIDQHGNKVGDDFPQSPLIANDLTLRLELGIKGEKFGCVKTSVRREFLPSLEDRYVPEDYVNLRMALKYSQMYINEYLRIYHVQQQHVSLSNEKKIKYPKGFALYNLFLINEAFSRIRGNFVFKIKAIANYYRMSFHAREGLLTGIFKIHDKRVLLFSLLVLPLAYALIGRDILTGRVQAG